MKRLLITTADERTWRRDGPVLFLGEWCRLYDRRAAWAGLDAEVVPYHWDDRTQLDNDYARLQSIYEELLHDTGAALNEQHRTDHSLRYWRILIGPWLFQFVHVAYDRWAMILKASESHDIERTLVYDSPPGALTAPDLRHSSFQSTRWNHYMFGKAIEHQDRIPWDRVPAHPEEAMPARRVQGPTWRRTALAGLRDGLSSVLQGLAGDDEAMIIQTYLPRFEEMKLQAVLGQAPKLWTIPREIPPVPPNMSRRQGMRIATESPDAFVRFAASMIPEQLPTVFLEGYRSLTRAAELLPWPSRPRVIFTSNLDWLCTVFQEWAATKVEAGHPLVIGQHGGFVGTARRHPVEDHQLKTSDRYLSWGWSGDDPRVQPAMIFTNVGKPMSTWRPSGGLLLVTASMPLYAYRCFSQPVGPGQSVAFVEDQIRFATALGEAVRARLTVRINQALDREYGACHIERWREAVPEIDIDPSVRPIEGPMRRCRLFVYTYNSTGFLESLARNIPTLMFWNPGYFELRPAAEPYFDLLARARIYHAAPESAAEHAMEIWDDVAGWWNQPAVQQARHAFCERYARMPRSPLRVLKEALLTASVRAAAQEALP